MKQQPLRSFGRTCSKGAVEKQARLALLKQTNPEIFVVNNAIEGEIIIEIGAGMGDSVVARAKHDSTRIYIASEVYVDGCLKIAEKILESGLCNLRIMHGDIRDTLKHFADKTISEFLILFPDPWPKKRHNKRRLINHNTLDQLAQKLRANGKLLIATDHADYCKWIMLQLLSHKKFTIQLDRPDDLWREPDFWFATKYQEKASPDAQIAYIHASANVL